jgi:hypothetical protein
VLPLVACAELGQPLGKWLGFAAQGVHGLAGLAEPVGGYPVCLVEELYRPRHVAGVGEDSLSRLDVQSQSSEGVTEQIVDLAGDPGALV